MSCCRFLRRLISWVAALSLMAALAQAGPFDSVKIEKVKTSIYVGSVTLTTGVMHRSHGEYSADYHAKVFPYFFQNESGRLWITFSDADLENLAKGQTVYFKGHAENTDKEARRIEGRAVPNDAKQGKIKVRVFVSPKIELIFNTTYRFE
ncbi:MAG TPA: hypothetical protein VFT72_09570 [Opitutaceae bacterium]|nr:hypothetical protein [Opitutaceae bacterium]